MKKLPVLLMALVMSVSVFSACKKNEDKEADKGFIKEIVASYTERMVSGDASALEFVIEESDFWDEADEKVEAHDAIYKIFENVQSVPEGTLEEIEKIRTQAAEKYVEFFDYELKEIKVRGDKATAQIVLTTPDVEKKDIFRQAADEKSKKAFTKEEINTIMKAQGAENIPSELFIKAEKEWFKAVVEELKESVREEKITYRLEKTDDGWFIVGEDS